MTTDAARPGTDQGINLTDLALTAEDRAALSPAWSRPVPTFADRTATDAPLPTRLPDALDELRETRAERDEAAEDRDLLRAENANLTAGLRTAQKQRDEALDARNVAQQLADFRKAVIDRQRQELDAIQPLIAAAQTWRWSGETEDGYRRAEAALMAAIDALPPSSVPSRRTQEEPASEEVRWAYRWIGADGQVYDEMDASDNAIETAEQRAHRIAAKRLTGTVRGEVLRYRVLTMPAEVVATYPAEARS